MKLDDILRAIEQNQVKRSSEEEDCKLIKLWKLHKFKQFNSMSQDDLQYTVDLTLHWRLETN